MKVVEVDNFDLVNLVELDNKKYPFLLESVTYNQQNRYSILFAFPQHTIKNYAGDDDFLQLLTKKLPKNKTPNPQNLPFVGGYFIYLAYEFASQLEKNLNLRAEGLLAQATYIPCAIIKDHSLNKTFIVDEKDSKRIDKVKQDIAKINQQIVKIPNAIIGINNESDFINAVNIAKKYIKAGDIFQANLSRKWQIKLSKNISDIAIYQALKLSNPAPFSGIAILDDLTIISSSPERLFSVEDGIIQTRPIAGTRPRGDDEKLKNELKNNLKEQAEHIMLLDLERNDLGRICEFGSVEVDEVMKIETYEFVHHIVSNIKGKLQKNITFSDIIKAVFPGGTITGCPKIRSMQIISELEKSSRSAYTGSFGYISNCGKMDFNILIRTMVKNSKNISLRAGAGIVVDSDAKSELLEIGHKARGMLNIF